MTLTPRPQPQDNGHSVPASKGSYSDRNSKSGAQQRRRYMNGPTRSNTDAIDVITDRCLKCGLKSHHIGLSSPPPPSQKKSSGDPVYSTDIKIIIALMHRHSAMGP